MLNPPKNYDGLYGEANCKKCRYFQRSTLINGRMRCRFPENIERGKFGPVFRETPGGKNHLGKCKDYEEADSKP